MYTSAEFAPTQIDPYTDPVDYIRATWDRFLGLSSDIIDLQHRAAVAAFEASQRGEPVVEGAAKASVKALAELQSLHSATVNAIERIADWLGLGTFHTLGAVGGVGAVPVSIALVSGLAILVAWILAHYEAQRRVIEGLEAGVIDSDDIRALGDLGPAPDKVLGGVGDIARIALWGVLAFFALAAFRTSRGLVDNPPLILHENPPARIGKRVWRVEYQHEDDGLHYRHDFGPGVLLEGEPDGSVRLRHRRRRRLWRDF